NGNSRKEFCKQPKLFCGFICMLRAGCHVEGVGAIHKREKPEKSFIRMNEHFLAVHCFNRTHKKIPRMIFLKIAGYHPDVVRNISRLFKYIGIDFLQYVIPGRCAHFPGVIDQATSEWTEPGFILNSKG